MIKYEKIKIFDEEKGFLLEVLFGLEVEFFSLLLIETWGFDELPLVLGKVDFFKFMGKLAVFWLHDTKASKIESTEWGFMQSGFVHVGLKFGLVGWVDDGYLGIPCAYVL